MLTRFLSLVLIILFVSLSVAPAQADQLVEVTPALGVVWRQTYFWILGISADFYLTRYFSISPEFYLSNKNFSFTPKNDANMANFRPTYFLQPGVMLNYHQPNMLAGAGIVYSNEARYTWHYEGASVPQTVVWEETWQHVWTFKMNIGFKFSKIRLYAAFLHPFQDFGWFPRSINRAFSITLGYTF